MVKKRSSKQKRKRNWPLYIGIFSVIGAVAMISAENLAAAYFYAFVATCCFGYFFGKKRNEPVSIPDGNDQEAPQAQYAKKEKYVINPTTMVVHRPSCPHAEKAYSFNKYRTDSLSAAISVGYRPCKYCRPK